MVWPALLPPWKRTTASACSASRSVIFPFPSSPHWAPTMTMPGMSGLSLGSPPADDLPVIGAVDGDHFAHLLEPRHRALGDLLDQRVAVQVGRDDHRPLGLVAGVADRVELLEHPRARLLRAEVVDVQEIDLGQPV